MIDARGGLREAIKYRIDVAQAPPTQILIQQADQAGKNRRAHRSAAKDLRGTLALHNVAVMFWRRSKRDVRNVPRAIIGNSRRRLPEGLGVKHAGPATTG